MAASSDQQSARELVASLTERELEVLGCADRTQAGLLADAGIVGC